MSDFTAGLVNSRSAITTMSESESIVTSGSPMPSQAPSPSNTFLLQSALSEIYSLKHRVAQLEAKVHALEVLSRAGQQGARSSLPPAAHALHNPHAGGQG